MPKTVLFVDDDAVWCARVQASLQSAGYRILIAQDASEAMSIADGVELGLLILDLDLEGESGLMLMKFLKENHPGVPVILFTALEHDDVTIQAILAMGANRYLPKTDVDQLIVTVGGYLKPSN